MTNWGNNYHMLDTTVTQPFHRLNHSRPAHAGDRSTGRGSPLACYGHQLSSAYPQPSGLTHDNLDRYPLLPQHKPAVQLL